MLRIGVGNKLIIKQLKIKNKTKMAYTKELIDKVKELYPNSPEIIKAAEDGRDLLGLYLDHNSSSSIPNEDILNATSLNELQKRANIQIMKRELYYEWKRQDPRIK